MNYMKEFLKNFGYPEEQLNSMSPEQIEEYFISAFEYCLDELSKEIPANELSEFQKILDEFDLEAFIRFCPNWPQKIKVYGQKFFK